MPLAAISSETLHVSTVAIDGRAVLIEGPSGSGKSDLALRLIDRGAVLVSDDYTLLLRSGARLVARPPETIAGKLEIRGLGIVAEPYASDVPVALLVRLETPVPRMPERRVRRIAGIDVRQIAIDPHPASAPILVERALLQEPAT
ncbi:aldolase [Sphingomonas sp. CROZ-RG-20F-R02-07]|uniref:HPr kinase/phosphorylase n=1 Tax=Sphingomonas sp. CROZ-RG-20F-R02-07 TaxID=2914832 RepID=UPI001F55B9E8|nr:aldolase [Sphingomonas sp. CROZ-RG-20F-R02-07]